MSEAVWVLTCNDQEQPPYKSFDVLAVARSREGIDAYLRRHWCDEECEMRTNEDGHIVERIMFADGWGEWGYRSPMDSPFVLSVAEYKLEQEEDSDNE